MYKLLSNGCIQLATDTEVVTLPPTNNGTPEWAVYQAWIDAGNTPAPADPEPPRVLRVSKLKLVRALRARGMEAQFNQFLDTSPEMKTDWTLAQDLASDDPLLAQALPAFTSALGATDGQMQEILVACQV
jgi:hypothetical protein